MILLIPRIVRMLKDFQAGPRLFATERDEPAYGCLLKEMDIVSGDVPRCQFRVASRANHASAVSPRQVDRVDRPLTNSR